MSEHLEDRERRLLSVAAGDAAASLDLGEWPIALTDALASGEMGLWVLTTERCLWLSMRSDGEDDELRWDDVESTTTRTGPGGEEIVLGLRGGDQRVYAALGDPSWASHLRWAVCSLAALHGEPRFSCPSCLIGAHDSEDGTCQLCGVPLVALPSHSVDGSRIATRLHRWAAPGVFEQLRRAVEAAELAGRATDSLRVVTDATLRDQPVLVVATNSRLRIWDAGGQLCLDKTLPEVTILEALQFTTESGIEVFDIGTRRRMALDNVGPKTWVADLLSRVETRPDDATSPEPSPTASVQPATGSPGGRRLVGDAEVGGVTVGRLFDAGCYVIAGIALLLVAAGVDDAQWGIVLGAGGMVYGVKIAITDTAYWVSNAVYIIALFAVAAALGSM